MDIRTAVEDAIKTCGGPVSLKEDGAVYRFDACIQPASSGIQPGQTRFGQADSRQFVYYGPLKHGGELVKDGAVVRQGEQSYLVRWHQDFCWKGKAIFRWAALERQEDLDGTIYEYPT